MVVGRVHESMSRNGKKVVLSHIVNGDWVVFLPATAVLTALFESGERRR